MAMTNEEAKALYDEAVSQMSANHYEECLDLLNQLDRERPNSRHVTYHRAVCLAELNRGEEAEQCAARLEGKLDNEAMAALRAAMDEARLRFALTESFDEELVGVREENANELTIQAVYPVSTEQCSVHVYVRAGVFHTGDELSMAASDGRPMTAPILRIGPAETPVNLVRAGQNTMMLLQADPTTVGHGVTATCKQNEEAYGATMVVSADGERGAPRTGVMTPELLAIERIIRKGELAEAERMLNAHVVQHPGNYTAHRMLAQIYLDAEPPLGELSRASTQIRKAYEMGGAEDPAVIHLLAEISGRGGETAQGLRFLERLYAATDDHNARQALAQRIYDYRARFDMGHLWQFADDYGEVIFETADPAEVVKVLSRETVPLDAKCRRDRVGDWQTIPQLIAPEMPEVAALCGFSPPAKYNPLSVLVLILLLAVLAALIPNPTISLPLLFLLLVTAILTVVILPRISE